MGIATTAVGGLIDAFEVFFPGRIAGMRSGKRASVFAVGTVLVFAGLAVLFFSPEQKPIPPAASAPVSVPGSGNCTVTGSNNKVDCQKQGPVVVADQPMPVAKPASPKTQPHHQSPAAPANQGAQTGSASGQGSVGINNGTITNNFGTDRPLHPLDEILPGYASGTVIRIDASTKTVTRIYFSATTPEGAKVELRQGVGNQFVFSVTDAKGDLHQAEVPLGVEGIPFEKFVYLFCEVGSASAYSYIRILVDGREVKREDFPFPLDFGSLNWMPTLGGGGAFSFVEMGFFNKTLDDATIKKLTENADTRLGIAK